MKNLRILSLFKHKKGRLMKEQIRLECRLIPSAKERGKWCIPFHFEQQELFSSGKRLKHKLCDESLPLYVVNNNKKN